MAPSIYTSDDMLCNNLAEKAKRFHGNTTIRDLKEENRSRISDFLTAHSSQEKSTSWDDTAVVDVGTGSGNIVISILKNLIIDSKFEIRKSKFFGLDFSENALKIAKQNAKLNKVDKNIKFLQGNLLEPILKSKIIYCNHPRNIYWQLTFFYF